jgi:hypothetical protein
MGDAGGFVHKATGQLQCGPRVEPVVTIYCQSCEDLRAALADCQKALAEARKSALDDLSSLLRERSKGEVETWGFVAAFMEMIGEIERKPQAALAGEAPKP